MNIDSFKTALSKGGVRPHLFRVQGNIGNTSLPTKVGFLCKAAQLPATTIGSIEVPFRGRKIKLPGEREFAEWTLTFLSDGDFELRNAFEKWMDDLNQTVSNVSTSEHNLSGPLFPDWRIDQLDRTGEAIKSYQFFHCWPSEVSSVDVSTDATDLMEFTVTLQYTYFITQDTDVNVGTGIAAAPGS
tara:strand:- start:3852 stop:4409 length:558 start_codon:yes stop_codon:yes gene_type:complete